MEFPCLDVLIEYRFDAGANELPKMRNLMARVFQPNASNGVALGDNLIGRYCDSVPAVEMIVMKKLVNQTRAVRFHYGQHIDKRPEIRHYS